MSLSQVKSTRMSDAVVAKKRKVSSFNLAHPVHVHLSSFARHNDLLVEILSSLLLTQKCRLKPSRGVPWDLKYKNWYQKIESLCYRMVTSYIKLRCKFDGLSMVHQMTSKGHWTFLKVTRKPICDFLLVFHCNCMSIFHPFRDILTALFDIVHTTSY